MIQRIVVLLAVCLALLAEGSASAGNEVGNGGDFVSSEFIARAQVILAELRTNPQGLLDQAQVEQLASLVGMIGVESLDGELHDNDGRRIDARVVPDPAHPGLKLIQLDRAHWLQYIEKRTDVYRLVFHEYLRVLAVDDDNYRVSGRLSISDEAAIETRTCGLAGTVQERIDNCALPVSVGGFGPLAQRIYDVLDPDGLGQGEPPLQKIWRLVARTALRHQVWLDETSALLWTERSALSMTLGDAISYCMRGSTQAYPEMAGIPAYFEMPERSDWEMSLSNGIFAILTRDHGKSWTQTPYHPTNPGSADSPFYIFLEGTADTPDDGFSWASGSDRNKTRCISRLH